MILKKILAICFIVACSVFGAEYLLPSMVRVQVTQECSVLQQHEVEHYASGGKIYPRWCVTELENQDCRQVGVQLSSPICNWKQ